MNIQTLLNNKHTSIAAVVYIGAQVIAELGAVWFPEHKDQFTATTKIIESAAVGYGLIMAGDAKPTTPNPNP